MWSERILPMLSMLGLFIATYSIFFVDMTKLAITVEAVLWSVFGVIAVVSSRSQLVRESERLKKLEDQGF